LRTNFWRYNYYKRKQFTGDRRAIGTSKFNGLNSSCIFLTNPDYPHRLKENAALNEISDNRTLFGVGTAIRYTDYPFLKKGIKNEPPAAFSMSVTRL
jgi:hypothetical protein